MAIVDLEYKQGFPHSRRYQTSLVLVILLILLKFKSMIGNFIEKNYKNYFFIINHYMKSLNKSELFIK